jgi:hypothetical protein
MKYSKWAVPAGKSRLIVSRAGAYLVPAFSGDFEEWRRVYYEDYTHPKGGNRPWQDK